jgi:plastocyanin
MKMQRINRLLLVASIAAVTLVNLSLGAVSVDVSGVKGVARTGKRPEQTAVIWLEAPNAPPPAPQMKTVHQRNLQFTPKVLAIRTGTTVDFPNEDRVFHNVFSFKDGKAFDLGIYPVGASKKVTFSVAGVTRLFCNIHPGMAAYIVAVDSPYFSAVNNDGTFTLPSVPAGTYKYHAWKPGREVLSGSVTVQAGSTLEVVWK